MPPEPSPEVLEVSEASTRVPAWRKVPPEWVLAVARMRVPAPDLVREPEPETAPLICILTDAVGISMVAPEAPTVRARLVLVWAPMRRRVAPLMVKLEAEAEEAPMELGRPPSLRLSTARTPPERETGPVKVLVVLRVTVALPDFVSPPEPERAPVPPSV